MEKLLQELRPLLEAAPSAEAWVSLCEALAPIETWPSDEAESLLDEIEDAITHWPDEVRTIICGDAPPPVRHRDDFPLGTYAPKWWMGAEPIPGEVRDTPARQLRLVRRLGIFVYDTDSAADIICHTLRHSTLTGLRACLICGASNEPVYGVGVLETYARAEQLTELEALVFDNIGLGREGFEMMATSPHTKGVTSLKMVSCYADGRDVMPLIKHKWGASLVSLTLQDVSAVLDELFLSPHLRSLRSLSLPYCRIGVFQSREHIDTMTQSPWLAQLEHLDLAYNRIDDEGLKLLLEGVSFSQLKTLDLRANELTSAAAESLANAPSLGQLTSLSVGENLLTQEAYGVLSASSHLPAPIRAACRPLSSEEVMTPALKLLEGGVSDEVWQALCAHLDDSMHLLNDRDVALTLAALEEQLATWPEAMRKVPFSWLKRCVPRLPFPALHLARFALISPEEGLIGDDTVEGLVMNQACGRLTRLEVRAGEHMAGISFITDSPHLASLRSLTLHGYSLFDEVAGQCFANCTNLPALESLLFLACSMTDDSIPPFFEGSFLKRVKHLAFSGRLTEASVQVIAAIDWLPQLESLTLHSPALTTTQLEPIRQSGHFPRLDVLSCG